MQVHVITGGDRDCVSLIPETVLEASALVFIAVQSLIDKSQINLICGPCASPPLELRIYLGPTRDKPSATDLAAIDETP
jgi:hypothetical protein